ncbi:MAG: Na+:solute symporter [Chlorobium sp.]|uniref:sodium:solute symporter family protein n=1 Tax=Chlorobium sp. TaxID=1095 RepID=UPI001D928044|nr:sodium:solute symporter family protein [Chlorobium sp.]MBN1278378.1 Na+:solute symporter [Chlorobiaceae bacterium]MCF8216055.1 Na+:solute symporter [Chlorobium sp.]MCF8270956.1 Na+:solute symporter [Chlorobium sp.]MCF8287330.1 Na+:solute symporter [Chlorobium sp.]MCF8291416.1 Na+:solute symporter [Chlorobium sp.]
MEQFSVLDYSFIVGYLILTLAIGLLFSSRASKNVGEFFLSGRKLPWWLAGTGMVATTFAADTPLAVAGFVAKNGIAGNWIWWTFVSGGMLTVFFFARLWRRANILTDLEFIELRYSGKAASFLRGFKAVYFGLFINAIIIGWVNLAMFKIIRIMMPELNPELTIVMLVILTTVYSGLSGLWGVTITDAIQFVIAMTGCIILAVLAMQHPSVIAAGGLKGALPAWMFDFFPAISTTPSSTTAQHGAFAMPFASFAAMAFVQWWASWYPGAEPGGGGYVAQRMMSAKDEKHSLLATLWFTIAHYAVRPWPWIIVGLVSLVMFPDLPAAEKEDGFVYVMKAVLPPGLRGLLVAAFLAAYMSTLATHLNWGTSYLINDFYKRFIRTEGDSRHYVLVSKAVTALTALFALYITFFVLDTITGAWEFIIQCGAGTGFVLIMRWFWWRLNAWSEITSMVAPFVAYSWLASITDIVFPVSLFIIVLFTISVTLMVTFLTPPTEKETLRSFYRTTRVGGVLWKKIAATMPDVESDKGFARLFLDWLLGIILVYSALFGTGKLIFGEPVTAALYFSAAAFSGWLIYSDLNRRGWNNLQ